MLLPRDLIIPALHHATAINNVRSQNLRHTARIYAISIAKRVIENGANSNTLHLKNHRNFIFALQIANFPGIVILNLISYITKLGFSL